MDIEQRQLKNGLKTLFVHSPGSTAGSVQIWFRAGSALEAKDHDQGIAHFLEHMFFKGTERRLGPALTHEIESYGGEVNAFTSFDYTCYYINTPNNHLNQTVDILLDMVANAKFAPEEIPAERDVVFEEYRRAQDNPHQYTFKELQKACFQNGYDHPILGSEESIKSFSRDQLLDFRTKFYNSQNSLFVIAGDLKNKEDIIRKVEEYALPQGPESSFPMFDLKKKDTINIHHKDVRQATFLLTLQAPDFVAPESPAEDLALNCLAHGETSHLYKALVLNNTLASSLSASTMFMAKGGAHIVKVSCPTKNLSKVCQVFAQTLKKVVSEGLKKEEIQRIKNQYIASKVYEKESLESFAFSLGHGFAQNGDIYCEDEFIDKIKRTSVLEVNKALHRIFSKPSHFVLQLPPETPTESARKTLKKLQEDLKKASPSLTKTKSKITGKLKVTPSKFDPEAKVIELKKGIRLIYRHNPMTPTFVFHAYLKGGLTEETTKNNGSYYLLGQMLTKGHGKISFEKLKNELEDKSASLNGFSGKNAYGLTLHGLSENTDRLLFHFFSSLLTPSVPAKFLKHEKELILRTLENHEEDPLKQCFKKFGKIIFKDHPYALDILGTPTSLKKISRTGLQELQQNNLKKKELLFTYCGDMELETLLTFLESHLKKIKVRTPSKPKLKKVSPVYGKSEFLTFNREQTQILIGYPAFKMNDKKDLYLKILTTFLSGQSSELFVEVRDRQGLCYAVQPIQFTALEHGYWGIYIASGHDKASKAIDAIMGILNKIKEHGFSKKELERVKVMIDGQALMSIQTNDDYANTYSIPTLHGLGADYQYQMNEKIKKITAEEFNNFLSDFLSKKPNKVIVGRTNVN